MSEPMDPEEKEYLRQKKDWAENRNRILAEVARDHETYEEAILGEIYEAAQKVKPDARDSLATHKLVFGEAPHVVVNDEEVEQVYLIKKAILEDLRKQKIIESFQEGSESGYPEQEEHGGVDDAILFAWVTFYPNVFIKFFGDKKLKSIPVSFDEDTGWFRVGDAKTQLKRNSLEFKVVKFLYDYPNHMHDYEEIGRAVGLIKPNQKFENYTTLSKLALEGNARPRRVDPSLTLIKSKIQNKISEVNTKLGLSKGKSPFLNNEGYMISR